MTAFEHLERELCAGVRRAHAPATTGRRHWRPVVLALIGALLVTAAALAASGTIRIGHTHPEAALRPRPHVLSGVRAGPAKTLALRVTDPAGGPPWTLRVFSSSRGAHCVQVGQVVRGHFGLFIPPGTLEPLRAWPGGTSSLCSGIARDGFPVVRGLQRLLIIGGETDPHRCPGQPSGDCPITAVTLLRYGLLGPGARAVRVTDAHGVTLGSMRTGRRTGGAYLFAIRQPVAPYTNANSSDRTYSDAFQRALRAARANGLSVEQATRRARASVGIPIFVRPPAVKVFATFANGQTLQVAGAHRSHAPLPGVSSRHSGYAPAPPPTVPVSVQLVHPGRFAVITVSFRAPVAITRFDVHYTQTLRGPIGTSCTVSQNGYNATTRDIARGETVTFTLRKGPGLRENGRVGWCRGRFTGAVRYSVPGRHTTIGRFAFRIP